MVSTLPRALLIVLVLLLHAVRFIDFNSAVSGQSIPVVDPLLVPRGHSSNGVDANPVSAIVTSPDPLTQSQRTRLSALAAITNSMGEVTTINMSSDRLEEIKKLDFVSGVFAPRKFRPTLDVSAPEIGAAFVWENVTDASGRSVDGTGIVIGMIDTGVDLSHPDLRSPNGTSKVLYLWDQTQSGNPPDGFAYGLECSWHEISRGECPEKDTYGHGTHVASIAVSSGLASGKYRGIAPGASLIVVKSGAPLCGGESWTFEEDAIIDGLRYLVDRAETLGMRLVINLSLGGNIGGHDDTSPLEVVIRDLYTQGVTVTVAAGNEAENQVHATGSLSQGSPTRVNWKVNGKASNAIVDVWYPSDRALTATLVTPSGETVSGLTSAEGTNTSDGSVVIASSKFAKGQELAISLQAQDGLKTPGWSMILNLTDDGPPLTWHAWVDSDSCSYPPASFVSGVGYEIDPNGTVSVPATSTGAIAVGAYVTKNSWVNKLGKSVTAEDYHLGDIAVFSSRGPTRDGRTKPDVSAPGVFIAAARSTDVSSADGDPDQYHRVLAGTSMAAPHVAGVVALMLQYNPQLTQREVRSTLTEGANLDQSTGFIGVSEGSEKWGWGKTDARTATSLFRVCSIVTSLPVTFTVSLTVDAGTRATLRGEEVLTLRFLSGDIHTFYVHGQSFTANDTRYVIAESDATFSSNGVFRPNVQVQYLLSLVSPLGQVEGDGWYDAGTHANFRVNPPATSGGFAQLLGVTFFFDHWVDEHENRLSSGLILMDSPHSLKATWRARLTDWRPILLLVALVAVIVLVTELATRDRRTSQSALVSQSIDARLGDHARRNATRHLSRR